MYLGINPKKGRIKTDAGITIDRAFLAHCHIPAPAATDDDVVGTLNMGAEEATVTHYYYPGVARNLTIKCNKSGITSNVTIYGIAIDGSAISETKALNGTTAQTLAKAFAAVTAVKMPMQTNTPAKQKATVAVTQAAQGAGNTVFTFVSAATGTAFDITIAFAAGDSTAAKAATVIATALNADTKFNAEWTATADDDDVIIERKDYAAQDATINLTVKTAGTPAISLGSIDVDAVVGVDYDKVIIGTGKKFGLPYKLAADEQVILKLFNGAKESTEGAVANSATAIESNTYEPYDNPDGTKDIDLYIIV